MIPAALLSVAVIAAANVITSQQQQNSNGPQITLPTAPGTPPSPWQKCHDHRIVGIRRELRRISEMVERKEMTRIWEKARWYAVRKRASLQLSASANDTDFEKLQHLWVLNLRGGFSFEMADGGGSAGTDSARVLGPHVRARAGPGSGGFLDGHDSVAFATQPRKAVLDRRLRSVFADWISRNRAGPL
jgi:hypothetical protein